MTKLTTITVVAEEERIEKEIRILEEDKAMLEKDDLLELLHHAITTDVILKEKQVDLRETDAMLRYSGGDARKLLNILER